MAKHHIVRQAERQSQVAQFVREAFIAQLAVIARDYNRGRDIYPDSAPLEPGRR